MPPQLICQTTRSQVGAGKVAVCTTFCHTDAASAATCMLLIALQAWDPSRAHPSRQMRREPLGSLLSLPTVKWRKPQLHSHPTRKEEDKLHPPTPHAPHLPPKDKCSRSTTPQAGYGPHFLVLHSSRHLTAEGLRPRHAHRIPWLMKTFKPLHHRRGNLVQVRVALSSQESPPILPASGKRQAGLR